MGSIRTDHLDLYLTLSHHISGSHRSRLGKFLDKKWTYRRLTKFWLANAMQCGYARQSIKWQWTDPLDLYLTYKWHNFVKLFSPFSTKMRFGFLKSSGSSQVRGTKNLVKSSLKWSQRLKNLIKSSLKSSHKLTYLVKSSLKSSHRLKTLVKLSLKSSLELANLVKSSLKSSHRLKKLVKSSQASSQVRPEFGHVIKSSHRVKRLEEP